MLHFEPGGNPLEKLSAWERSINTLLLLLTLRDPPSLLHVHPA
jgi:hypothetical protein